MEAEKRPPPVFIRIVDKFEHRSNRLSNKELRHFDPRDARGAYKNGHHAVMLPKRPWVPVHIDPQALECLARPSGT